MQKLQPTELIADEENTYRVRFQVETGVIVEYVFKIDNSSGFDLLVSPIEFLEITNGDPAADNLRLSIFNLHSARHFKYQSQPTKTTPDLKPADA